MIKEQAQKLLGKVVNIQSEKGEIRATRLMGLEFDSVNEFWVAHFEKRTRPGTYPITLSTLSMIEENSHG